MDSLYDEKVNPDDLDKALNKIKGEADEDKQTQIVIPCTKCGNENLVTIEDLIHFKTKIAKK